MKSNNQRLDAKKVHEEIKQGLIAFYKPELSTKRINNCCCNVKIPEMGNVDCLGNKVKTSGNQFNGKNRRERRKKK